MPTITRPRQAVPQLRLPTRAVRVRIAAIAAVGAGLLALALAKSGPLLDALERALAADPRWTAIAVALEIASVLGYVVLFHHVVVRSAPGLGLRHSYAMSVGGTAASRLLPTAGLGGIAVSVVVLRRAGLATSAIAERLLAFLVLLYAVFVGALLALGAVLGSGLLPTDGPRVVAAGAAALAAAFLGVVAAAFAQPRHVGRALPRAGEHLAALPAAARRVRGHLRRPHPALAGALAWWAFDAAVLWAMLRAFGAAPAVWVVVFAYFLGSVANLVPIPGALSGGLFGVLAAFGVPAAAALVAVLAYRAVALWLPTPFGLLALRWLNPGRLDAGDAAEPAPAPVPARPAAAPLSRPIATHGARCAA